MCRRREALHLVPNFMLASLSRFFYCIDFIFVSYFGFMARKFWGQVEGRGVEKSGTFTLSDSGA